ncbi:MAG: hypothetical protein ABSD74_03595 [Rhizomicrobium sp.]|jgi:hypothetical protein
MSLGSRRGGSQGDDIAGPLGITRVQVTMSTISDLQSMLTIGFLDHMGGGLGHMSGHFHKAGGIIFGGKLLIFGMVIIAACALGAMASLSGSDWVTNQTRRASYGRAAGWAIFLVVAAVAGIGLARLL